MLGALKIRPGEAEKVILMALYLFLAVFAFITGRITRDSLFLSAFDKSLLAWMYVTIAVAVPVPAYIYARFADRFRRDRIILTTLLIFVGLIIAGHFLIATEFKPVYIVLYNFVEILGAFLMIQFWTFAGDLFPSRDAKRLFPVIGGGGVIAGMVSGVAVGSLAKAVGTENLLLLQALLLGGCFFIVRRIGRMHRLQLQEAIASRTTRTEKKKFGVKGEIQDVFKSKHLRIIAGMTVATFLTVPLVDYAFKVLAKAHYTSDGIVHTDELTAFMGVFYTLTGVIAAVTQFGFASRLLERFGVVASLLILPVSLLMGSVGMMLVAGNLAFAFAVATKGAENSFRYSIYDATMQVIYTPVPGNVRGRAKTFIDGILKPWAGGIAGGVIVLFTGPLNLPLKQLSYVAGGLTCVWIALVLAIRREYVTQLLTTLRKRRLDFSEKELSISDDATVDILRAALNSDDVAEVRNAVELATRVTSHDLSEAVAPLLERDEPDIKVLALDMLGARGSMRFSEQVQQCFDDDDERVNAAAIRSFCALVGEPALRVVARYLESPAPAVRGAAVASLIKHGGLEGILFSAEHLKLMQASDDPQTRLASATVFREIGVRNFYQPVLTLMRDESARVQTAAIHAAGAMKSAELVPALVYKLSRRETARAASAALVEFGEEVVPTLGKVLAHDPEDVSIRRQIPRILERIGTQSCLEMLMQCLDVEDPDARRETARAAARLRDRLNVAIDEKRVELLFHEEVKQYYQLLAALDDLTKIAGAEGPDLLRDAIEERLSRTLDRIFRLLGILYPLKTIDLIYMNLRSATATARSNAVEVLDNLIEREQKRLLLPIVEDLPRDKVLARGAEAFELKRQEPILWVGEFLDAREPWLVVVALYVIAELGLTDFTDKVVEYLGHPDPVARETALRTLTVLLPPRVFADRCDEMTDDDDEHVSRYAESLLEQVGGILEVTGEANRDEAAAV